ncbi:hypothetical protein [Rhizobium grahamii]|uniref:Uncharacterized protein n=1 Tax=Rhizobium grahamii CCGE 502 TaxID=990285 RepID=S3ICH3_9HYPH|nr:hypothetical protein [Rhizobium grahamii]EPE96898.1 hypothetical protein RGCCGE502_18230 [Rhizobium grahamii CCGE 502]
MANAAIFQFLAAANETAPHLSGIRLTRLRGRDTHKDGIGRRTASEPATVTRFECASFPTRSSDFPTRIVAVPEPSCRRINQASPAMDGSSTGLATNTVAPETQPEGDL